MENTLERLVTQFQRRMMNVSLTVKRYLFDEINWENRLISVKGSRGVGKTTLLLQHIKLCRNIDSKTLYTSLDDIYFQGNTLVSLVEEFYALGGRFLYLDEVHKYENWSREIKSIYDNYQDLYVVFTSSSILEINKGDADLSRRAVTYELHGLSFREYLNFEGVYISEVYSLSEILQNHTTIAQNIASEISILPHFNKYIEIGVYPFFKEGEDEYLLKLNNVIKVILETDIPAVYHTEYKTINKIKRLLFLLSSRLPYIPNISKLSEQIETSSRNSTLHYLDYLEKARLTSNLKTSAKGSNYLVKPDKIYLENTNLMAALNFGEQNTGTIRETFFNHQLGVKHNVSTSKEADFLIDDTFTFEVGGRSKKQGQIKGLANAFIAADRIEMGFGNKIPLYLFGLMY
ncbi:MAG: ATP-binding protein [Lishizhenia sp.]